MLAEVGLIATFLMLALPFAVLLIYNMCRVCYRRSTSDKGAAAIDTMVVLGSGGHTTEMLSLLDALDQQYRYHLVVSNTDSTSLSKVYSNVVGLGFARLEVDWLAVSTVGLARRLFTDPPHHCWIAIN